MKSASPSLKKIERQMTDLLRDAVDGHGGLSRWSQSKTVKASLSITGAIWQLKGKPDTLKDMSIEAEQHNERLITDFNGQGTGTLFQPTRIIMEKEGGRFVDSRRAAPTHKRNDQAPGDGEDFSISL
jgi:hypothetical protein